MSRHNIIRAWKDEQYRQSLSAAERETMPSSPAGLPERSDGQLMQLPGGLIHPSVLFCPTHFSCDIVTCRLTLICM